MFMHYDLLALGAAACWACGSLLSVSPARHLGAFAFTRWRMLLVSVMLWLVSIGTGGWHTISLALWKTMSLSGFIGIFIGDTALFSAMNRLGPRRAGVLFATHAVFSALLGFSILNEHMNLHAVLGGSLTILGVMTAVFLGRHKEENHAWEADRGNVSIGVVLALLSAICQAVSTLIAKPVMMQPGIDAITASAIRVSMACSVHFLLLWLGFQGARSHQAVTLRVLSQTALNGFIGMGMGMTLILLALKHGDLGIVSILSAVSPVLVLPLLWLRLGRPPALGAWLGAALTVMGTALVLSR